MFDENYGDDVFRTYLAKCIYNLPLKHKANVRLLRDIKDEFFELPIDWPDGLARELGLDEDDFSFSRSPGREARKAIKTIHHALRTTLAGFREFPNKNEYLVEKNLKLLQEELSLTDCDIDILRAVFLYQVHSVIENLIDTLSRGGLSPSKIIATITGQLLPDVIEALEMNSRLMRCGLVHRDNYAYMSRFSTLQTSKHVQRVLKRQNNSIEDIRKCLFGAQHEVDLSLEDFQHIGTHSEVLIPLLANACERKEKGVNILLWGVPGGGKTSYGRVLAHEAECALYDVGEADQGGSEPSRDERIASLQLAQAILEIRPQSLLLVDEAEDILSFGSFSFNQNQSGSKIFCNRLLEENEVPTLWIANDTWRIPEPMLRRMTYTMELKTPPPKVRARIWSKALSKTDIQASDHDVSTLAHQFNAPPSLVTNAIKTAQLTDQRIETVGKAATTLAKTLGIPKKTGEGAHAVPFDTSLLNTDTNLEDLTNQLKASKKRNFSLCLYGHPGTGKTQYIHYLAEQLDMEVLAKRGSDILGMYVGQSEKNIALAFEEAKEQGAFLVLDESDTFLRDRGLAEKSWENSLTNEMLTQMEAADHPFGCTTNLMDNLDKASLRRFTFKVGYDYLTKEQVKVAYLQFFKNEPNGEVLRLQNLTHGDFAVVAKKLEFMTNVNSIAIAKMLRAEENIKCDSKEIIGF